MKCAEYKVSVVRECESEYKTKCNTPETISNFWHNEIEKASWFDPEKEALVAIFLSPRTHIKGYSLITLGTLDASLCHPREVFRPAIISAAASIVICHHHPSGDSSPSAEDIRVTKQLVEVGKIVDMRIMDHVIIGKAPESSKDYCSLRESGVVDFS